MATAWAHEHEHERRTLKAWRELRGDMSQQDLAMKVGASLSTIANIETHRTEALGLPLALKIAAALDVPVEAIIWSDRPYKPRKR